jgi:hypothetical protein
MYIKVGMLAAFVFLSVGSANAQYTLSLVEGAACAQTSMNIEKFGQYNNKLHDEISEKQANADRRIQNEANALVIHFNRMVELRQKLIAEYDVLCSRGSMSLTNLRKVCRPQPSGISFRETVFCKPLKELP